MENIKQMQERHTWEKVRLQAQCTHPKISDWQAQYWAIGHSSGYQAQTCLTCGKLVHTKRYCRVCGIPLIDRKVNMDRENKKLFINLPYCDNCTEKGDPECISLNQLMEKEGNNDV